MRRGVVAIASLEERMENFYVAPLLVLLFLQAGTVFAKERALAWASPDSGSIYFADASGDAPVQLFTGLTGLEDLSFDPVEGQLYWTRDARVNLIQRSRLRTPRAETVLDDDGSNAIAVDPVSRKLYFAAEDSSRLRRSNLNGSDVEVLSNDIAEPTGIAIDLARGRAYWSDMGNFDSEGFENGIGRVNLDGTESEIFLERPAPDRDFYRPADVAFDRSHGLLYFIDDGQFGSLAPRGLYVVDPDEPESLRQLSELPLKYATSIAIDSESQQIYWTDSERIMSANLDGTGVEVLFDQLDAPTALTLVPEPHSWQTAVIGIAIASWSLLRTARRGSY